MSNLQSLEYVIIFTVKKYYDFDQEKIALKLTNCRKTSTGNLPIFNNNLKQDDLSDGADLALHEGILL